MTDLDGGTPVDGDEAAALIPGHIVTRGELNAWEQANILEAATWAHRTRKVALDETTIRELHRRMFDETWEWAGQYRRTDKNLGVPWPQIPADVRNVIDDGRYWVEHRTFPIDEAAIRLHHRLVAIHPFPNGNGRHARLWCDLLLRQNGRPPISWRSKALDEEGDARRAYIQGLRRADQGDITGLAELFLSDR